MKTEQTMQRRFVLIAILLWQAADAFVSHGRWTRIIVGVSPDVLSGAKRRSPQQGQTNVMDHLTLARLRLVSSNLRQFQSQEPPTLSQEPPVPKTLREAFKVFFFGAKHGPRIVVASIIGLAAYRMTLLPAFSVSELILAVSVVGFWCIQEHVLHRQVLHSQADWWGKRIHQGHHDRNYFHISIDPAPLMISWMSIASMGFFLALPTKELAISASVAYSVAGLWYEWTHFIVHTKVRFRPNSYFDVCKTHHARHHRVDSNHWLAFSYPGVDNWFGTNPTMEAIREQRRTLAASKD